ncbi:hypothetical protein CE195_01480 [Sodalis-like symbiont of Philaenus spumarius]|nr:hypothetical protein CE195_01480 [Sodalis-like symbiont of Philaenus spumarius]
MLPMSVLSPCISAYLNGYRVALLDTHHYGCAVHIATFSVSEAEMKKIQKVLGGEIEECMQDPGELIDGIIMPERRRLLGDAFK